MLNYPSSNCACKCAQIFELDVTTLYRGTNAPNDVVLFKNR